MQTYTLTLFAPGGFSATIAISGTYSLYELAETLIKALDFDFDHAFGFYNNIINTDRSDEKYTLFADMDEPEDEEPGVKATLVQEVFQPGKAFCFFFDYGDDWMFIVQCESVEDSPAKRKSRRILKRSGTPPMQYEYPSEDED